MVLKRLLQWTHRPQVESTWKQLVDTVTSQVQAHTHGLSLKQEHTPLLLEIHGVMADK